MTTAFNAVRARFADLLNSIDDARDDVSTTEKGVDFLTDLETEVEALVHGFDETVDPPCSHNLMVNNTTDNIGWHCEQCGHVETPEERAQLDDE